MLQASSPTFRFIPGTTWPALIAISVCCSPIGRRFSLFTSSCKGWSSGWFSLSAYSDKLFPYYESIAFGIFNLEWFWKSLELPKLRKARTWFDGLPIEYLIGLTQYFLHLLWMKTGHWTLRILTAKNEAVFSSSSLHKLLRQLTRMI